MSEENKHMDDAFKKASGETKAVYNASFWKDAEAKLNDANLDDAFRAAALGAVAAPAFVPGEGIEDMFMDAAFVDASSDIAVKYDPSFYEQFKASEAHLEMDEAFQAAAAATVVDYAPQYWGAADQALQNEGLHYDYQSAYWSEAKKLLDKSDRKGFFIGWTAVAAGLIMISLLGNLIGFDANIPAGIEGHLAGTGEINKNERIAQLNSTPNSEVNTNLAINDNNLADNMDADNNIADANNINGNAHNNNNLITNKGNPSINKGQGQNTLANNNLGNNNPRNNGITQIKNPVITLELPTLSPIAYKELPIENLNEVGRDVDNIDFYQGRTFAMPELEIYKGEDNPRGIHNFALLAMSGIGNQWSSAQNKFSLRNSIGAEYSFSPAGDFRNFEIGTSIMVHHIKQSNLTANDRSSSYDIEGGFNQFWRLVQITDLFYTNLNLNVNYRITPKMKIKANVGVDYLTAVRSNMSYRNSVHDQGITTVNNNWGVKEGVNKIDLRIGIGYEFQLTNRIGIMFSANAGFFDRTNDEFLGSQLKDKDVSLMFGLKYNLFRKI